MQAGLAFFVLVVGGSLLYSWHADQKMEAELGPIPQPAVPPIEKMPTTNAAPAAFQTEGVTNTPNETTDTQMPEATEALPNETETLDVADAFGPADGATERTPAENVPVSPFGFGPYPEVPADFPGTPIWERDSWQYDGTLGFSDHQRKNLELLSRVLVKMWVEQGVGSYLGGTVSYETGLVYPYFENTIYVKRTVSRNPDGTEGVAVAKVLTPGNLVLTGEEMDRFRETGETPPGLRILQIDTDGIEPYEFLNLQR